MKILILTQYFPPEVGAAQNRLFEMASYLLKKGLEVEVLTAMPNYPSMIIQPAYKNKWYVKENMDGLILHRCWIYTSTNKSIFSRLLNYFSFVFSSLFIGVFKVKRPDFLFCESPPLFLGITALILKKLKRTLLIINVADLWPEIAERFGLIKNRILLDISYRLESLLYSRSILITGQTQGIVNNIQRRFPKYKVHWLPNGADLKLYDYSKTDNSWRAENGFSPDDFIMLYAGTIGHQYNWEMILNSAKTTLKNEPLIKWVIIGSGAEKEYLVSRKKSLNLDNVIIFEPMPRSHLPGIWKSADVLFLPLKNLEICKGIVPAKAYEAMAMKITILLGATGEAKEIFIDKAKAGITFTPDNENDFLEKTFFLFNNMNLCKTYGENGYDFVHHHFNRQQINEGLYNLLLTLEQKS